MGPSSRLLEQLERLLERAYTDISKAPQMEAIANSLCELERMVEEERRAVEKQKEKES